MNDLKEIVIFFKDITNFSALDVASDLKSRLIWSLTNCVNDKLEKTRLSDTTRVNSVSTGWLKNFAINGAPMNSKTYSIIEIARLKWNAVL